MVQIAKFFKKERKRTDRQIIESTIALNQSCVSKEEQENVYILLVKYRGVFHLKDEIDTCPNIEIHLTVMDKSPFFVRPFHVNEKTEHIIDKEM